MKKLVVLSLGLCACCLLFGGIALSREHYTARAETVENENVEAVEAPAAVGVTTSLTVHLEWTDINYRKHPCKFTRFQVDKGLFPNKKYYTDGNGFCTLSAEFAAGLDYESELIIYAAGEDVEVKTQDGTLYCYRKSFTMTGGEDKDEYVEFVMGLEFGQAMQIAQAVITGTRYVEIMTGGKDVADVTVSYPDETSRELLGTEISYYWENVIHLWPSAVEQNPRSYASWDVILHEYGHHVQHIFGISESPGGTHYVDLNCIDLRQGYHNDDLKDVEDFKPFNDSRYKENGVKLAWGERWPTFFSLAAQQFYAAELRNIDTVGDARYDAYNNVHQDYETNNYILGEGSEDAIIQVLYRMYHPSRLNLGHQTMWNYVMNSKAVTFSQFAKYIYNNQLVGIDEFGTLLAASGFAPTDFSIKPDRADQIPTIIWNGTGGSSVCPYNYFTLYFYDQYGTELPCRSSVTSTNTGDTYSEPFNASYWDRILRSSGSFYFLRIEAMQKGDYTTGPYSSPMMRMEKPLGQQGNMSSSGQGIVRVNLDSNECQWFRYEATQSGVFNFRIYNTYGDKNMLVEMYPYMFYTTTTTQDRLYYSNNTDSLAFNYNVVAGEEYYFKVSFQSGLPGYIYLDVTKVNSANSVVSLAEFKREDPVLDLWTDNFRARNTAAVLPSKRN